MSKPETITMEGPNGRITYESKLTSDGLEKLLLVAFQATHPEEAYDAARIAGMETCRIQSMEIPEPKWPSVEAMIAAALDLALWNYHELLNNQEEADNE